jgi:hypothetical protein
VLPAVAGAIGVAGGVLLGRNAQPNRKILGVPVPNKVNGPKVNIDLANISEKVGEASRQFGKLAGEVKTARQRAEQIGKAAQEVGKAIGG